MTSLTISILHYASRDCGVPLVGVEENHCIFLLVPQYALKFTRTFNEQIFYIMDYILIFFTIKITQAFKHTP